MKITLEALLKVNSDGISHQDFYYHAKEYYPDVFEGMLESLLNGFEEVSTWEHEAMSYSNSGAVVAAVKLVKTHTGFSLRESKFIVDHYRASGLWDIERPKGL